MRKWVKQVIPTAVVGGWSFTPFETYAGSSNWIMKFPKDPGRIFFSKESEVPPPSDIVDGRNPAPGEYVDYPIIYRVSYIPGG